MTTKEYKMVLEAKIVMMTTQLSEESNKVLTAAVRMDDDQLGEINTMMHQAVCSLSDALQIIRKEKKQCIE